MPKYQLIPPRMIADLQRTASHAYDATCYIYTDVHVSDGFGGQKSHAVHRLTVPCNVSRAALVTPEFRTNADQIAPDISWLAMTPADTPLYDHDHIVWGDDEVEQIGVIQVVAVIPSTLEIVRRAYCRNGNDFNPTARAAYCSAVISI